jgi:predicted DNA-binding mobile mystery protein A
MKAAIQQIVLDDLESRISALGSASAASAKPARGWLRAVREAIGLSQSDVAERMAVKRQSYAQFETAEEAESISVASLRKSAAALGCDLVYFLVPAGDPDASFKALAERHDPRSAHLRATEHSMSLGRSSPPDGTS